MQITFLLILLTTSASGWQVAGRRRASVGALGGALTGGPRQAERPRSDGIARYRFRNKQSLICSSESFFSVQISRILSFDRSRPVFPEHACDACSNHGFDVVCGFIPSLLPSSASNLDLSVVFASCFFSSYIDSGKYHRDRRLAVVS